MMSKALAIVVAAAVLGSGCGYSLAGRGSFLPTDIRVVGIPLLGNLTATPRIEQIITEKIRTEFINRAKRYDIRPTAERADAVLSGAITSLVTQPAGLTDQQLASRQQVTITMRLQFTDSRNGQVLWSNEVQTFRAEYDMKTTINGQVDSTVLLEQEGPAFDRMATELARSVVAAILEAF